MDLLEPFVFIRRNSINLYIFGTYLDTRLHKFRGLENRTKDGRFIELTTKVIMKHSLIKDYDPMA